MNTRAIIVSGLAVAIGGCLDLQLLDDMLPLDAGQGADPGAAASDDGSGDGSGGPPAADPNDEDPPQLVATACGALERVVGLLCVAEGPASAAVRFATDEPAVVGVTVPDGATGGVLSAPWASSHHLAAGALEAGAAATLSLTFEDVNGNGGAVELEVIPTGGPAIAITEVLADPVGTEPDQEFVEIVNMGAAEVDLAGWMIDDNGDANGDLLPDGTLLGVGQVALVVSPDFDPTGTEDPPPAASALLIWLESSIGSSGLKNSDAESVELYDADGRLISEYRGQAGNPKEGWSAARVSAELPDGDEQAWELDPSGSSSPGTVPTLP